MSDEWDMNLFFNCDECPWPGKCSADCCCWLDVEWQEDKPTEEPEPEPPAQITQSGAA